MRKFSLMIALAAGLTTAAGSAQAGAARWGQDLHFVAETSIPGSSAISLCHLVDYASFLFIPVYTSVDGYALSNEGCAGGAYRDLSAEHFQDLQAAGMIPTDLPATPRLSPVNLVAGHAWIVLAAFGLMLCGMAMLGSGRARKRKAPAPDALAIHSLVAMSQVAVADGHIDTAEIRQISSILTRLTGKGYSMEQVSELLTQLSPSPSDMAQVGQDLSEADRQIVLEAALNIAVADGEIHPSEYAVVSDLAQRMRIGAEQFRGALNRIAAHLQTAQPA